MTDAHCAVYANSFYAALNTRRSVRGRGTENDRTTVPTFLMVGQTTTFKHEGGHEGGPVFSTVSCLVVSVAGSPLTETHPRLFGHNQTSAPSLLYERSPEKQSVYQRAYIHVVY